MELRCRSFSGPETNHQENSASTLFVFSGTQSIPIPVCERNFRFSGQIHHTMRTLSFIIFLLLVKTIVVAQTISIDNVPVPVSYYRLPENPLNSGYTTYSAEIDIDFRDLSNTTYTESSLISEYLRLDGFKKVNSKGDIRIEAEVGDFVNWGEYRKTSRHKSKDKNGVEREVTKHYIEMRWSMPIGVIVKDKEGDRLIDKYIFTSSDIRTYNTPTYNSLSDLDSHWRIDRTSRLRNIQKERVQEGMRQIYNLINSQFGYTRITDNTRFETIGKKKHPEYELYQKHVEIIKTAFKLMDADKGLDPVKKASLPALDFYKSKEATVKGNGKDELKLKHIILYNQALAYFWFEDFAKAKQYAVAILKLDPKDKDAKRLSEIIEEVQYSLEKTGRKTRHAVVLGKP